MQQSKRFSASPRQGASAPPLFVAVHAVCDKTCWYCTEHGENRTIEGRLSSARLLEILAVAYAQGIRTFRLTGGEPTLRTDLDELLSGIQALGDDVRIAMTTNGARLARVMDVIRDLREPRIFLSIDGLRRDRYVQKWLTSDLQGIIDELTTFARTRFNFVLTRANRNQLPELIDYAVSRGIDLKIFELLLRDYFYAGQRPPEDVFSERYISIRELLPELRSRFGEATPFAGTGGRGIPMYAFRAERSRIIYFDSLQGSHYGDTCDACTHYPCQEGLYALLLDVNGTLHPAGCENRSLYFPLGTRGVREVARDIQRLLAVIEESSLRAVFPEALVEMVGVW